MGRRVFIYEFITGGGTWTQDGSPVPAGSLLREGQAMAAALVEDFAALADVSVAVMRDVRLPEGPAALKPGEPHGRPKFPSQTHPSLAPASHDRLSRSVESFSIASAREHDARFAHLAATSDATLLVAPEFDGLLLNLCLLAESVGARLLSPGSRLIAVASNKCETARALSGAGVPVPRGALWDGHSTWPDQVGLPAVLKPNSGAGSLGLRWLETSRPIPGLEREGPWRVETWIPGQAASAAVLNGPAGSVVLPGCWQRLSDDRRFCYLGGATPLPLELDQRARRLARAATAALPNTVGYVGVDLVLGADPTGSSDVVVEVNPRLTTSYVGLRRALSVNLAQAMWDLGQGLPIVLPSEMRSVQFDADGSTRVLNDCR